MVKFGYMRLFGRVAFENGLQYRHFDSIAIYQLHYNILATFCANMMKIGLVIPEITTVINGPFWMRRQKSAYLAEYLTNCWTDLHQHFRIGKGIYDDYKTYISFAVVQEMLLC